LRHGHDPFRNVPPHRGQGDWRPDPETFLRDAWQGREELWLVFWVYFVFGHGVVLGLGSGMMVMLMVLGFVTAGSVASGAVGLLAGFGLLAVLYLAFAVWSGVSVWRCADTCRDKDRGQWARVLMVGYATAVILAAGNLTALLVNGPGVS